MNFPPPIITREHGSWAVLFVPMIVAVSTVGTYSVNNLFLALSALGVFMSYVPVHTILREMAGLPQGKEKLHASFLWASIYLIVSALFILPLFRQGYFHLTTFAVIGVCTFFGNFLLTLKWQKTILGDLTAVAGLTLSAPSAYYISAGMLDVNAWILWLLNFLFFGSSVFYVHMKINVVALKKESIPMNERLTFGRMNILYHFLVVSILVVMVISNYTPALSTLAFVPMVIHAIYGTFQLNGKVKFKTLGVLLLAQSFIFCVLLVLAWS